MTAPEAEGNWSMDEEDELVSRFTAAEWRHYGFYDPAIIQEWDEAVGSPEKSGQFDELGIPPRDAHIWDEALHRLDQMGHRATLDEVFEAANGNAGRASVYSRHFPVSDWPILKHASVTNRDSPAVFKLTTSIEKRDEGKKRDRQSIIFEAVNWLGSNSDYSLVRMSLLQNVILMGRELQSVQFVVMNSDSSVSAVAAVKANDYVEQGGYAYDAEGVAAYTKLSYTKAVTTKEFEAVVEAYGVRKVIEALDTGLSDIPQIEHYLRNGGVIEIARGVL